MEESSKLVILQHHHSKYNIDARPGNDVPSAAYPNMSTEVYVEDRSREQITN